MKKLFLLLLLFTNICLGQSFSSIYNFSSVNTTSGTTDLTPVPTSNGVTFGSFISNGVSPNSNAAGRFSFTNWDIGAANASNIFTGSINLNKYYQVTITPQPGYNIDINSILFSLRRSGTGIRQYVVRSSLDNYTNNLSASITTTTTSGNLSIIPTNIFQVIDTPTTFTQNIDGSLITLDSSYNIISSPITFRFYGFNAEAAGGTFSIDNVTFNGVATTCSGGSNTWNGTSWSNITPPTSNIFAIIDGNYDTSTNGNIDACSVIVNTGKTLTINTNLTTNLNPYLKIQNELVIIGTGNVIVEDDGSIVQVNDNVLNTGNITYNRTVSSLNGYDYIYWSSPVGNGISPPGPIQTLSSLYNSTTGTTPPTNPGFQYQWNPTVSNTNSTFGNWEIVPSNMTPGRGYIMRASSSYGWAGTLTSQFVGIPNNGVINYTVSGINSPINNYRWNLIGNPYPSSINALSFLTTNAITNTTIDGFVNIWTHGTEPVSTTNPYYQSFQYNYTSNDYITHNGTGTSSGPTGFNGYIASGQGFLVNLLQANTPTSNIVFNNSMRSETYSNSQFYRTSENNNEGRIWLDLLNTNNIPTRLLVGYKEDATIERDRLYDAITTQDFYTTINNDKFIIQGRPEFNENDQVILGINITTPGEYKIAIAETDGILTTQNIYLQDLYSNTIHDIRQSPYTFNSVSGTFNDRFILRYTNNSLGNNDFVINNTIIYNKDSKINIDSNKIIKNVKVYDITGKLLYDNNFNSNNVKISLECSKQILFVKIKTEDDQVITRKILND